MRLLVLRPDEGAQATAARIIALGHIPVIAPLFVIEALPWAVPDPAAYDALLLTSANTVRMAGAGLTALSRLPVYAVGAATADAARGAGLTISDVGRSGVVEIMARAAADGMRRPLHLTGIEHRDAMLPDVAIDRIAVYRAVPIGALPALAIGALENGSVALLHSPRAASHFGRLVDAAGLARESIAVAAISEATADAAGEGWRAVGIAPSPTDADVLTVASRLGKTRETEAGSPIREGG